MHSLPLGVYLGLELQNVKVGMYLALGKSAKQVSQRAGSILYSYPQDRGVPVALGPCYHLSFSV